MAYSPWTLLGQGLGTGFNQGMQDQYKFHSILNKANKLTDLGQNQQALALALMGAGRSGGNPLDAVLANYIQQQLGMQNTAGTPTTTSTTSTVPAGTIRVREKASGQTGVIPSGEFDSKLYDRI